MNVSYKVSFPDVELDAIHGKAAMERAIEFLKTPEYFKLIKWEETHDEDCECTKCLEGKN